MFGLLSALFLTPGQVPPPPTVPPTPPTSSQPMWPREIGGKDLNSWIKDLTDKDPAVREGAVKIIPLFGPDAIVPSSKGLIAATRDEDPGVRVNAIMSIGGLGAKTPTEAKPIIDALKLTITNAGVGSVLRLHAAKSLMNYGTLANDAIGTVAGIAKDTSWETRRAVAMTLGRIGNIPAPTPPAPKLGDPKPLESDRPKWTPSEKATATLRMMMAEDPAAIVRLEAVQSLILLGPPVTTLAEYAAAVGPTLNAAQERIKVEKEKSVQIWLIMLVMRIDGNELTPANVNKIAAFINTPDINTRVHAMSALGLLGEKARPAIPAIIDALKMPEPVCVAAAITSLSALGENAKVALTELEKIKAGKDEILKKMAEDAIDVISGKKKK